MTGNRRVPERFRSAALRPQGGRLASAGLLRRHWDGQVRCRGRASSTVAKPTGCPAWLVERCGGDGFDESGDGETARGGRASPIYRESRELGHGDLLLYTAYRLRRCCRSMGFGKPRRLSPLTETRRARSSRRSLPAAKNRMDRLTGGPGARSFDATALGTKRLDGTFGPGS